MPQTTQPARGNTLVLPLLIAWCLAGAAGVGLTAAYGNRAAATVGESPFSRRVSGATLVVALHPQCPCSRATLTELQDLLARSARPVALEVLAYQPSGSGPAWLKSPLVEGFAKLPHSTVVPDIDGKQAARQKLSVSGEVLFYDEGGTLRFRGGITASRGHAGANRAASLLASALSGDYSSTALRIPVFGCSLRSLARSPEASRD